jgi:N-acetylglucosaminyl-diphospho-decaprenol L-rhamnosyltransferase
MPDVSIIVVSFNSEAYLEHSLGAVVGGPHEVIVVDSASTDGSVDLVRRRFPSTRLFELRTNVGFGAASNEGLRVASGRYVLLMNPDAWPVGEAIDELVRFADARPEVGIAGPLLRAPDGTMQQSAFGYPTARWLGAPAVTSRPRRTPVPVRVAMQIIRRVAGQRRAKRTFLVGTALLLRREAILEVGRFDPDFFMFNEEIDLCWRFQEAGWQVELCTTAEFVHVGGASTRTAWPMMYREQLRGHLLFLAKHQGPNAAEQARRHLTRIVRLRVLAASGETRVAYREAAVWLASGTANDLVARAGVRQGPPDLASR